MHEKMCVGELGGQERDSFTGLGYIVHAEGTGGRKLEVSKRYELCVAGEISMAALESLWTGMVQCVEFEI